MARTVDPAVTEMMSLEGVVGFGPPLQARSLDVTSVIGPSYVGVRMPYDTGFVTPSASSWRKIVWADAAEAAARIEKTFIVVRGLERKKGRGKE